MVCYNRPLAILLILSTLLFIYALAFGPEEILGGYEAFETNYKYHVAIIGRHNSSRARTLMCAGGIISQFFILGYTQCFINSRNELRKIRVYVVVALHTLKLDETFMEKTKEVLNIYTYTTNCIITKSNIAVLELAEALDFVKYPYLKVLQLPSKDEPYVIQQARVAGYGYAWINERKKYAFVDFPSEEYCKEMNPFKAPEKEICGVIKPDRSFKHRGLCTYDEGAPLVIDHKLIVAVAGRNRKDCDDTICGSIYSNVTFYLDFINGVISRNHIENTITHANRPRIVTEP